MKNAKLLKTDYIYYFISEVVRFRKLYLILAGVIIVFIFNFSSAHSDEIQLSNLRDSVNKYYYTFDIKNLKNTLKLSEKFIDGNPDNYYGYYYNGILRYCLGRVVYNIDRDIAYDYFDESIDLFDKAFSIKNNAVSLAMVSAAYGKKSALSPISAIFFGQKAKNRIFDAFNLDSNNSKILLVAATHLMHVPGIYGGDKKKARRMLERCLILNRSKEIKDENELRWADNAEIYAYLAQLDILEEDIVSARSNMKKALELQPNYGFVKIDLEKQLSKIK